MIAFRAVEFFDSLSDKAHQRVLLTEPASTARTIISFASAEEFFTATARSIAAEAARKPWDNEMKRSEIIIYPACSI